MNVNALRSWGMAVSAVLMAGALGVAALPESRAAPQSVMAQAQPAAPIAFLVRFQGTGPIARAQARAARGQTAQAERQIAAQLARQTAFAGLCFDRFTVGAAEVVLRSCDAVAANQRAAVQAQWLQRLQAMRAVAYVDANASASPARAPG